MWEIGKLGIENENGENKEIRYWVKHFDEGGYWGINDGRISKLSLKMDGKWVANYDRGWDQEPECEEAKKALEILMKRYN